MSDPVQNGSSGVEAVATRRPWRVGRKVGRTIYVQIGDRPADTDPLIGVMDTPGLASLAVLAVNMLGVIDIDAAGDA